MPNPASMKKFLASDGAASIRLELLGMVSDPNFNTKSTYSPGFDGDMPFEVKHMNYLGQHPNLSPQQYISNLKLMTRIR